MTVFNSDSDAGGLKTDHRVLTGYDDRGVVFDAGDRILRRVKAAHLDEVIEVLELHRRHGLQRHGIVAAEFDEPPTPEGGVISHPRYRISYPHEWTSTMFRDATLFHLGLFSLLEGHGIALKDAIPQNILFEGTRPVFVDFFSLLPAASLAREHWLFPKGWVGDPRLMVLERMFLPYFMLPLLLLAGREYFRARRMLSARACNSAGPPPEWRDLLPDNLRRPRRSLAALARAFHYRRLHRGCRSGPWNETLAMLRREVESLEMTPPRSGYRDYYSEKEEAFSRQDPSDWKPKQKSVVGLLEKSRPDTVLDLGANTGWFSLRAAEGGAEVVAVDSDESVIDELYRGVKDSGLKLLPLLLSFRDLERQVFGIQPEGPEYRHREYASVPLLRPAVERLRSETVLLLGLSHHLLLGDGMEADTLFGTLSRLTGRTLVFEYVDLEDEKIRAEPNFFPALHRHSRETCGRERILEAGLRHFRTVSTLPSHPGTRSLLVFER